MASAYALAQRTKVMASACACASEQRIKARAVPLYKLGDRANNAKQEDK